jgi:hypothetical protein
MPKYVKVKQNHVTQVIDLNARKQRRKEIIKWKIKASTQSELAYKTCDSGREIEKSSSKAYRKQTKKTQYLIISTSKTKIKKENRCKKSLKKKTDVNLG